MIDTAEILFLTRLRRHSKPTIPPGLTTPSLRAPAVREAIVASGIADKPVAKDEPETYRQAFQRLYNAPLLQRGARA